MDWWAQIDGYCERLGPGLWAEPWNAATNLAFLVAAVIVWPKARGWGGKALTVILFVIGIGSALFHTFATAWAALADTAPIGFFILLYLYLVHRDVLGHRPTWGLAAVALFLPYAWGVTFVLGQAPFFQISSFYWTVPILLAIYAFILRRNRHGLARDFLIGAAILSISITARSLDLILCDFWPLGTHVAWHVLNAVMLGYMIVAHGRHRLAGQGARR